MVHFFHDNRDRSRTHATAFINNLPAFLEFHLTEEQQIPHRSVGEEGHACCIFFTIIGSRTGSCNGIHEYDGWNERFIHQQPSRVSRIPLVAVAGIAAWRVQTGNTHVAWGWVFFFPFLHHSRFIFFPEFYFLCGFIIAYTGGFFPKTSISNITNMLVLDHDGN